MLKLVDHSELADCGTWMVCSVAGTSVWWHADSSGGD